MSVGLYSVKQYTPSFFKIVRMRACIDASEVRRTHPSWRYQDPSQLDVPPGKFYSSLSRAKAQVYQYALCNEWQFFATFTLDKKLKDRFDLKGFNRDLSRFLRNYRRKAPDLKFLLIPEQHKDGAWHMHGLIAGLPEELLREFDISTVRRFFGRRRRSKLQQLHDHGYLNWPDYAERFGFVSLGRLRSPEACARYVTKYISKSMSSRVFDVGCHLYYASRGLRRAERILFDWAVTPDNFDECLLQYSAQFCECGWLYADRLSVLSLFQVPDDLFSVTPVDLIAVVDPDCPWGFEERPWELVESDYQLNLEVCYDSQENQIQEGQSQAGALYRGTS